jgi:hypothetical protein
MIGTKLISYTGNSEKIILIPGTYLFECWGAQGYVYDNNNIGGRGAYTKGTIKLSTERAFYAFVGGYGKAWDSSYSFNGGGFGQYGGGGASDIRLTNGTWHDFGSLKSRIMVASGGGGPDTSKHGGAGGCLVGLNTGYGKGGTQTEGGAGVVHGSFGKGGGYSETSSRGCGAGGGGYYGGGSSTVHTDHSGGGGSSFISGYQGCNAIAKESTESSIIHLNSSVHYSGLIFTSPIMIDGLTTMPSPTSSLNQTGNEKNGYIRITVLKINRICSYRLKYNGTIFMFILTLLLP